MVHCTTCAQTFSRRAQPGMKYCGNARFHTLPGDGAHVSAARFSSLKTPGYTAFNPFATKEAVQ